MGWVVRGEGGGCVLKERGAGWVRWEEEARACLYAGVKIAGYNDEVMPSQVQGV